MRVLKFMVTGQRIEADPGCNFSGLFPGTEGYLRAEFDFDGDWAGCEKIGVFSSLGVVCRERLKNNACMIPAEAVKMKNFFVSVVGLRPGYRIVTAKMEVKQDG